MINTILIGIVGFVFGIITAMTNPIMTLINQYVPDLSTMITQFTDFLSQCVQFIGWVISLVGFPPLLLVSLALVWTIKLTLPLLLYVIKTVLKWWHMIAP